MFTCCQSGERCTTEITCFGDSRGKRRSWLASRNKNGTEDLGIMQINTGAWLNLISHSFFDGNNEKAYIRLRDDGCFNIYVGAWILGRAIRMEGGYLARSRTISFNNISAQTKIYQISQ